MVSRKRRIGEFETAAATETCLALMHHKALCDPGASINLMPKTVFQKLGIEEAKPTTVMLQLANQSFVQPEGKIEDILVRIDKFIFPADVLILGCDSKDPSWLPAEQ
ncbi:hypothetical protein V6N12_045700 [Hibiscus sabdariffa]|uniref:Aspartic peptidase DDI1-type domain-containing protein n=1 Tax=Hibiscus sabdariffa TaxID=183260 RepID=A0ABR2G3H6_9ROSI